MSNNISSFQSWITFQRRMDNLVLSRRCCFVLGDKAINHPIRNIYSTPKPQVDLRDYISYKATQIRFGSKFHPLSFASKNKIYLFSSRSKTFHTFRMFPHFNSRFRILSIFIFILISIILKKYSNIN